MKQLISKTSLILLLSTGLWLINYSCNKQSLNATESILSSGTSSLTTVASFFNPTVGAPIKLQTGKQWIANFTKTNGGISKEYIIASQDLKNILSNTNCVGICLYFAIDDKSQAHLLPIGIDASGRLLKTKTINTQNGVIDWTTAKQWIANDLDPIDARFFGSNTFSRLFKDAKCASVRAISALDEQNKPQLLLIDAAFDYKSSSSTTYLFQDRSSPCPPICGIDEQ